MSDKPQPYSIDADPLGIRKRVTDAVTGALAFGAQGTNPPPEGHWLGYFWRMARAERAAAEPVADATLESAIEASAGRWVDSEFRIDGPDLMRLLRSVAVPVAAPEPALVELAAQIERQMTDRVLKEVEELPITTRGTAFGHGMGTAVEEIRFRLAEARAALPPLAPPAAPPASDTKSKTVCQTDDTCEVDISDIDEEGRVPGCIVETYWMPAHTIEVRDGMLMLTGDDGGTDAQMRVMLADIPGFAPPAAPQASAKVRLKIATDTIEWQSRRLNALQEVQAAMRDPERTMVCDILANGKLLPVAGRYAHTAPPPPATDVEAMTRVLFAAWEKSEPEHPVTMNPTSFMATFADMARAALAAAPKGQP